MRGLLNPNDLSIAIVGTRKATTYGTRMTSLLTQELCNQGITIVSGLAYGIDAAAHKETLRSNGRTIAVLGSGVDDYSISPTQHRGLAHQIISNGGAVISEYPPGTPPSKYTFPKRNRIIAGMSAGTVVTEAGEKSGALITAQCALDNGRELFAIPHPATSELGKGPHKLLRDGAHLTTSANDILNVLSPRKSRPAQTRNPHDSCTEEESAILRALSAMPTHIDDLARSLNIPAHSLSSTLAMMEMKGYIENTGGMHYKGR